MIKPFLTIIALILVLGTANAQVEKIEQSRKAYNLGVEAYKNQDYQNAGQHFKHALALRPYHPGLIYTAASVCALNNQTATAITLLNQLARMGLTYPAQKDDDFSALRNDDRFLKVVEKFTQNQAEVAKSATVFSLPEKDLITECVALDTQTNTFFVSSVHRRKIVQYKDGKTSNFTNEGQDDLWSVFALRIDAASRTLWVSSSATPQMKGYNEKNTGQAAVFEYDIDSGKLRNRFILEESGVQHWFGDLIVHSSGDLFISDSKVNAVYSLKPKIGKFETLIKPGYFASLQGITFSENQELLYAADYSQGLFVIDMKSHLVEPLPHPKDVCLIGIDGLYFHKNSLIATQNGTRPNRVVRIKLSENLKEAKSLTILEANTPELDDPTLGNIASDTFYYIANSQWNAFDDQGNVISEEKLKSPIIRKIALK